MKTTCIFTVESIWGSTDRFLESRDVLQGYARQYNLRVFSQE